MRRLFTSIALLGAVSLVGGVASGATGNRAAPAQAVKVASATFQDATGENASAPDITTITVASDDAGNLNLQVAVPNRLAFTGDMELLVGFDSDNNAQTGASDLSGSDYLLSVIPASGGGTSAAVGHWNGVRFASPKEYPSLFQYANGLATITINRSELGGTGKFNFLVAVASNIDFANNNYDNLFEDDAPDGGGVYAFDTGLQPIEQPVQTATKLLATEAALIPTKPKMGTRVMFGVSVETDIGTVPSDATVTCKAKAGKKALKAKLSTYAEGVALCGWTVPKGTKGKTLRGSATVSADGLKLTRSFAARIR
jgi:hypothetical protein